MRKILEKLACGCYLLGIAGKDECSIYIDATLAQIKVEIEKYLPKEKEIIDIRKKVCSQYNYPITPCLYDELDANGETCSLQDKKIPKEQCKFYKDFQIEYEDFIQYNQAIAETKANIEKLFMDEDKRRIMETMREQPVSETKEECQECQGIGRKYFPSDKELCEYIGEHYDEFHEHLSLIQYYHANGCIPCPLCGGKGYKITRR